VPAIASTIAFCLAVPGSLWDPGVRIQISLIRSAVVSFVTIAGVAAAIRMTIEARRLARGDPPRAKYVYVPLGRDDSEHQAITLIMGRSRQFGVNIFVTIYYEESLGVGSSEVFERAIGVGRVVNIQENGLIQVQVLREVSGQSGLWQRVRSCEAAILSHVMIKPSIDFNAVGIEVRFDD
jgi:hypothetical protein